MQNQPILKLFQGRKLVIATMHGKERVIAPLLKKHLGVQTIVPKGFDSDKFGTFTREIKRIGNQVETARAKLLAALKSENADLGVSSEGSFGAHPSIPFIQSNFELVLLVDKKNGYEIQGHHRTSETNMNGQYVANFEEALEFAKKIGFPEHGIILRKSDNCNFEINKNIQNKEQFIQAVSKELSGAFSKGIFIESDMRAHKNPTRMKAIEKATEDLIKNIFTLCPKCQAPGFVAIDVEKGVKCSLCKMPTDLPLNEIYQCSLCGFKEKKLLVQYGTTADPQYCGYCNP
ncbi:MAG TPA: hypothetical protein PKD37_07165 [Oligoflexia bacterium]|nr:hypothetical protein [Oligoflexia bacterium]HMP27742.1 hypothetical protein [Oligoflexia bacterium]